MNQRENRDPRTYAIIGAAMEVHRQLGFGFLEAVYQEALAIELANQNIPYQQQVDLPVHYKESLLSAHYRVDFLCFDDVIVEIKALGMLTSVETSQIINYLKASHHEIGLLINFGEPSLKYERFISTGQLKNLRKSANICG